MQNSVHLIAYADRLGGSVAGLRELLEGPLAGLFGGVHLLPFFFPYDGTDAGFDPVDHREVDPRLGAWADVRALGTGRDLMVDVIVNHVSSASPQFRDVLARGPASPYEGMFLTLGRVFPGGATEDDLMAVYRPRPGLPFTPMAGGDRRRRLFWTTFTPQQVDLDVAHPATRDYLDGVLQRLADNGATSVRLDAVGYAVKTPGTSCFMTPETFAFIAELTARARGLGLDVLVEVHSHHAQQIAVGREVDRVYDFALPPLVLHALYTGDGAPLRHWLGIRPGNAVTVLDTHDGIGIIDVGPDAGGRLPGLLEPAQVDALVERIHDSSGGGSRLATGTAAANLDLYQVNCTFYDALGRDDRRYLLARLLQFFTPGVPQVYYVGLLAGTNDVERLARTGVGRDVNRRVYDAAALQAALARPVVRALCAAIRFRSTHPAFGGTFTLAPATPGAPDSTLTMTWRHGNAEAVLTADLATAAYLVSYSDDGGRRAVTDFSGDAG